MEAILSQAFPNIKLVKKLNVEDIESLWQDSETGNYLAWYKYSGIRAITNKLANKLLNSKP